MSSIQELGESPTPSLSQTTVLVNARVGLAGDIGSLTIENGNVTAVGGPDLARPRGAEVINLDGRTVLPGFWDAHVHSAQWASSRRRINLRDARSPQQAAAIMGSAALTGRYGPGEVLVGYGFRDGLWDQIPDVTVLDNACPENPAVLISNDLHAAWLNRRALHLAEIPDHPSGLLVEDAAHAATRRLTHTDASTLDEWIVEAARAAAARGIVGITDFETSDTISDWSRRSTRWALPIRVACAIYPQYLDQAIRAHLKTGDAVEGSHGQLEVGHLKIFVDGSLNTRTALCTDPYPGLDKDHAHGMLRTPPAELQSLLRKAVPEQIYPAVHAIGDRAISIALDAFEEFSCPGRIEHAQLIADRDFNRVALPGLVLGVQPSHLLDDRDVAELHWAGRTSNAFAYGALLRAGAVLEIGSDAPVGPMDPWVGIAAAVHRSADGRSAWHPDNALTVADALAAASRGRRDVRPGTPADLVITDDDPAQLDPAKLAAYAVAGTISRGSWTHRTID